MGRARGAYKLRVCRASSTAHPQENRPWEDTTSADPAHRFPQNPLQKRGFVADKGAMAILRPSTPATLLALVCAMLLCLSGVGLAATSSSVIVTTDVEPTISITDPFAINPSPAPQNGTTYVQGNPGKIDLGEMVGTEQATGSATWRITTNAPNGYSLNLASTRATGTVLQTTTGTSFPDMSETPGPYDPNTSRFGVSVGDSISHAEAAVSFGGSQWGSVGGAGTQGTLYRGVPFAGMPIARRSAPITNDPITINFAATLAATQPLAAGTYTGAVRLTASTL